MCNPVSLSGNPDLLSWYQKGRMQWPAEAPSLQRVVSDAVYTMPLNCEAHTENSPTPKHPHRLFGFQDSLSNRAGRGSSPPHWVNHSSVGSSLPSCCRHAGSEFGERRELDRVCYAPAGDRGSRQKGQTPLVDLRSATVMYQTHLSFLLCVCLWHGVEWMCSDRYLKCTVLNEWCDAGCL